MSEEQGKGRSDAKAWLRQRLEGERARAELVGLLRGGFEQLEAQPLAAVFPAEAVQRFLEAYLTPDMLAAVVRPWAGAFLRDHVRRAQADPRELGRFVPGEAAGVLERLVARPGFVDRAWVEALFREKATEEIISDLLYRSLRDFSTLVPRIAMRVLPLGPFAKLGAAGGVAGKVVEELERLLEPEIRSFLSQGSKKALERASSFAVDHLDDPASIELRKNVLRFILARSPAFHTRALGPDALAEIAQAAEAIARHVAGLPEVREELAALIAEIAREHGAKTIGACLKAVGIDRPPDFEGLAGLIWPIHRQVMAAPAVQAWLDGLVDELIDRATSSGSGPA